MFSLPGILVLVVLDYFKPQEIYPILLQVPWLYVAMGLALLSEFAVDAHGSARLTAMAFFGTYLLAAIGPLAAGLLMDGFDSWALVYSLLATVLLMQLLTIPALRRGVKIG